MKFLLVILLCCAGLNATAQGDRGQLIVVVKAKKIGRTHKIKPSKTVKIVYNDTLMLKGHVLAINDSTVQINGQTIALSSINSIAYKGIASKVLGVSLLYSGGLGLILGTIVKASASTVDLESFSDAGRYELRNLIGNSIITSSLGISAAGGGFLLVWRSFSRDNWVYSIESIY